MSADPSEPAGHAAAENSGAPAPVMDAAQKPPVEPTPDPLLVLTAGIANLLDALGEFFSARTDQVRLRLRRTLLRAAALVLLAVCCVAVVISGAVFLALAIAMGVGAATGQPWIGYLAAAFSLFALAGGAIASTQIRRARSAASARASVGNDPLEGPRS